MQFCCAVTADVVALVHGAVVASVVVVVATAAVVEVGAKLWSGNYAFV